MEEVHEKFLKAQDMVDEELKKLAEAQVQQSFAYEYLYLVAEMVGLYDDYVDSLENDDYETAIKLADQIVSKIQHESSAGILKVE